MFKVKCPSCSGQSYTSSPTVEIKCAHCDHVFSGGIQKSDDFLAQKVLKRNNGLKGLFTFKN